MNQAGTTRRADPLARRPRPRLPDMFLQACGPVPVNAFGTPAARSTAVGEDRLAVRFGRPSRPSHLPSGNVLGCLPGASTLPDGRTRGGAGALVRGGAPRSRRVRPARLRDEYGRDAGRRGRPLRTPWRVPIRVSPACLVDGWAEPPMTSSQGVSGARSTLGLGARP